MIQLETPKSLYNSQPKPVDKNNFSTNVKSTLPPEPKPTNVWEIMKRGRYKYLNQAVKALEETGHDLEYFKMVLYHYCTGPAVYINDIHIEFELTNIKNADINERYNLAKTLVARIEEYINAGKVII